MKKLYWMSTESLNDPAVFQKHYREMSAGRRAKIDRARMEQDKRLSLAAGILLDRGLREYDLPGLYSTSKKQQEKPVLSKMFSGSSGLKNEQTGSSLRDGQAGSGLREKTVCIKEDLYGKPYLPDFPELYFNLSHSHEMAMAVFADADVGCDIELRKKPNDKLANRFFCPDEIFWMQDAKEEKERAERFSRLWTLKESFIKATGQGLRLPLDSFCFQIEDCERLEPAAEQAPTMEMYRRNSSVTITQTFDSAEYVFEEYRIGQDGEYCAAVCTRRAVYCFAGFESL